MQRKSAYLMRRTTLLALSIVLASPAYAAIGIDCKKAQSKVELMICDVKNNPELWSLDSEMNTIYNYSLQISESKQSVSDAQKKWLKEVRNVCSRRRCLKEAYEARISDLQQATTLCKAQEVAILSCRLPQSKTLSLCASQNSGPNSGYLQYRIGIDPTSLEIEYPQQKAPAKEFFKYSSWIYAKASTYGISFWDENYRYSLFINRGAIGYNGAGVIVSHGHPPIQVSVTECISAPATFSEYGRYSSFSLFELGKSLELPDADEDISTYKEENMEDLRRNYEMRLRSTEE